MFNRPKVLSKRQALHSIAVELHLANELKKGELQLLREQVDLSKQVREQLTDTRESAGDLTKDIMLPLLELLAHGSGSKTVIEAVRGAAPAEVDDVCLTSGRHVDAAAGGDER